MSRRGLLVAAGFVATAGACAHIHGTYRRCDDVSNEHLARVPSRLSETGLFADARTEALAEGVVPFRPRFELWSDGATKRRWVFLPPGSRIDTSDMDAWRFLEGTKFWKEFVRDGVRVETRLLYKFGPHDADWVAVAYAWRDDGEALAAAAGVADARGTQHDIPPAKDCMGCHGGTASRVLGFGAIQLAHAAPDEEMSLERLLAEDLVTDRPERAPKVPGDAATEAALGYLHANCAHCHNQQRPQNGGLRCFDPRSELDLSLRMGWFASFQSTPLYATAIGSMIVPGDPDGSPLFERLHRDSLFKARMPPLATEEVDRANISLLETWIREMSP